MLKKILSALFGSAVLVVYFIGGCLIMILAGLVTVIDFIGDLIRKISK